MIDRVLRAWDRWARAYMASYLVSRGLAGTMTEASAFVDRLITARPLMALRLLLGR